MLRPQKHTKTKEQKHTHAGIESLKKKRQTIHQQVLEGERQQQLVQKELAELTEKLHRLNASIAQFINSNACMHTWSNDHFLCAHRQDPPASP